MSVKSSHAKSSRVSELIYTWPKAFMGFIALLLAVVGWLIVDSISDFKNVTVPSKIKNEVTAQLPDAVKTQVPQEVANQLTTQISAQIKQDIDTQAQQIKSDLSNQIREDNKQINLRIDGIFAMIEGTRKTLGEALKILFRRDQWP